MGLLSDILTFPVTGPAKGLVWVIEKIQEQAENELFDEGKVRGQLAELELRFDLGEISEQEYEEAEAVLLDLMKVIRLRQAAGNQ